MFIILENQSLGEKEKKLLFHRKSTFDTELYKTTSEILTRVQKDGVAALEAFSLKYDQVELKNFIVSKEEIASEAKKLEPRLKKAFKQAYLNIKKFHVVQRENLRPRLI